MRRFVSQTKSNSSLCKMSNVDDNGGNRNSVPYGPRSDESNGGDGVVHTELKPTEESTEERERPLSGEVLRQIVSVDASVVSERSRKTYNIQQSKYMIYLFRNFPSQLSPEFKNALPKLTHAEIEAFGNPTSKTYRALQKQIRTFLLGIVSSTLMTLT